VTGVELDLPGLDRIRTEHGGSCRHIARGRARLAPVLRFLGYPDFFSR